MIDLTADYSQRENHSTESRRAIVDLPLALRIVTNILGLKKSTRPNLSTDLAAFLGFKPEDVQSVYFWKTEKEGTWFRLHVGRVFDENAQPSDTEEEPYKAPYPPPPIPY